MNDPMDKTSLTETETLRSGSPPPPVEPDSESQTDAETTDAIEDQVRRGWPDEPTTS